MKSQRRIPKGSLKRGVFAACVMTMLCLSQTALAQSGRRSKSAPSPPTPVAAEPKAEPSPSPSSAKPKAHTSIIVGKDRFGSSNFVIDSYAGQVLMACIDRINESSGLQATGASDMTRKDAIDRAKKGKDYVLWVEVRDEQGVENEVSINYAVYTPETAKILTSGRVYLGSRGVGKGGVMVGVPTGSRQLPLQYQMKAAGQEVADRVVSKFALAVPDAPR